MTEKQGVLRTPLTSVYASMRHSHKARCAPLNAAETRHSVSPRARFALAEKLVNQWEGLV
jgi:hypothetical protein